MGFDKATVLEFLQHNFEIVEKHWGPNSFYTIQARKYMEKLIEQYDAGEVIPVHSCRYIEDGIEFEDVLMSDETTQTWNYGYID